MLLKFGQKTTDTKGGKMAPGFKHSLNSALPFCRSLFFLQIHEIRWEKGVFECATTTKGGNNNLVSFTTEFLFHLTAGIEPCHAASALRSSAGLPSSRGDGDPAVNKMCSVSLYKVYSGVCTRWSSATVSFVPSIAFVYWLSGVIQR